MKLTASLSLSLAAGVASFMELVCSVAIGKKDEDPVTILKTIQQMAVLVQGNWAVKSDLVYPKDSSSESGVPNEVLQRTRDLAVSCWNAGSYGVVFVVVGFS